MLPLHPSAGAFQETRKSVFYTVLLVKPYCCEATAERSCTSISRARGHAVARHSHSTRPATDPRSTVCGECTHTVQLYSGKDVLRRFLQLQERLAPF